MGILEDILARAQWMPTDSAFPAPPPVVDQAAEAAAAREAAGQKLIKANQRRPPNPLTAAPDAQSAGVQLAMDNAPPGTGVPFSTQAGMLAPPVTVGADEPVPLPMERPAEAGPSATDLSSRNKPPQQILPPAAQPDAQASAPTVPGEEPGMLGGLGGLGGLFGKLRTTLGDNSNTLLALGAGLAGAPNIGQGISRAAAAAIPARAADIKQALERSTQATSYKAMVAAGVPENLARAAMGDKELKKSVIDNYMADRKGQLVDVGFDRYGQPIKGIFDPYSKTITPLSQLPAGRPQATNGAPIQPGQPGAGTDVSSQARVPGSDPLAEAVTPENDVTGPDYLERLREKDPAYARQVEQVLNGDAPMPTGRNKATMAFDRKLRQDVLTVEPNSSDSDFQTRNMVRKSYSGGNDSKVTKSINTTLEHAQRLAKSIERLDNFNFLPSVMNPARNLIKGETSEAYQKARGAYETDVANFAKELDFAVSGGRPTVSGTKHQMEGFKLTAPKSEQLEKLKEGVELLKGRLDSHATGYAKGMKKAVEPIDFVDAPNRQFYQNLIGDQSEPTGTPVPGVKAPKAAAAPAVPKVDVGKSIVIQTPNGPVTIKKVSE